MEKLQLIKIKNPFNRTDRDMQVIDYQPGQTLFDIRNAHFPADVNVVVSMNGKIVPRDELSLSVPVAGSQILFISDIESGQDIIKTIAIIAVVAAAPYLGAAVLGYGWGAAGVTAAWTSSPFLMGMATGLIGVGGSYLVNSLLPQQVDMPKMASLPGMDVSQTYGWNPQTTQQQGLVVPKFYGTNKLYGNIIGSYLENDGEKQYINALISLGLGPINRLYDFKINDQPKDNLKGITIHERRGYIDQDTIENFNNTKKEYSLSVKVVQGSPYTYLTPDSDFDELEIDIAFPQGLWHMKDDGNFESYFVDLKVEIRKQGGGALDWVPLSRTSQVTEQTVYNGKWSAGRWVGDTLPGKEATLYWYEYLSGETDPNAHYEGQWFTLAPNAIKSYLGYWWRWIGEASIKRVSGTNDFMSVYGDKTTATRKTFFARNLPKSKYEIRVSNLTPDKTTTRYGDDMYLTGVREVYYDDFEYPRHVLAGIKALATDQLSGSLRFSCMCEGSLIRVYNGSSWSVAYSENPAWVAFDILTQPVLDNNLNVVRYDGINPSRLDLTKFKEWADFCDGLVPDGKGGQEKRITFNGGFDSEMNMWEAVMQVCQVGRAMLVWNGVNLTVAIDKPASPVQLFTIGNIGIDSFKEIFLPMEDRAAEIEIDFVDRENGYERNKFSIYNDALTGKTNKVNLNLFGITKASEAWRAGMYRLYNNQYITRTVEFDADIDSIASTIGDVVNVQHDIPQWGFGGRIVSAASNTITLDREVTIEAGKSYSIMVRLSDDTIVEKSITTGAGTYTTLTVSTVFSSIPQQYDVFTFGEVTKVVKPFRIIAISRTEDQKATITAVEYNASIYNVDTDQPVLPTPNYSSLETLPSATDITLDELLIKRQDGTIDDVIDVYFKRPDSSMFSYAEVWFNNGAGWKHAGDTNIEYLRITGVEINKSYSVAVVTVNLLGTKQSIQNAAKAEIYTFGKADPPSQVTNFTAKQNGQFIDFNWSHIPDADLWGYEIRQGTGWEGGRVITTGISHNNYTWQAELNGTYRFLIKAIDDSNLYSNTATSVDVTLKGINENINIVKSQDEITKTGGPDGTKTNFVFVGSQSGEPSKFLIMPHMLTDTDVPNRTDQDAAFVSYKGDITLNAEYITNPIDILKSGLIWVRILNTIEAFDPGATDQSYSDRLDTDYPADTDQHITMPSEIKLYLCYSNDDITYTSWEDYKGTAQKEFRYIKIKITANIASQTGVLKLQNLLISLDVPDVDFVIKDFSVGASGSDILFSTYQKQLYNSFTVRASILDSTVNKVPVISKNNGLNGFNIKLRDKTDALVTGTVDIQVTGY